MAPTAVAKDAQGLIYLDYNATTPVDPEVTASIVSALTESWGNPSSSHPVGLKAKDVVERARGEVAELIGCEREEVVFTSGGTEANNWALKGAARALRFKGNHIVISAIEHPAVSEVVEYLRRIEGFQVTVVGVSKEGIVTTDDVIAAVTDQTILVSIMLANNEVGSLQPLQEISERLQGRAIALHSDASQAIGKIKIDWASLNLDLLTIAGHKLYAPKGVSALIIRRGTPIHKFLHGGGQERGMRGGTESSALIAGLGKACALLSHHSDAYIENMRRTRDRLKASLQKQLSASSLKIDFRFNGPEDPSLQLPNTLSLSIARVDGTKLLASISSHVACSSGAACHEGQRGRREEQSGGKQNVTNEGNKGHSTVLAEMGVPSRYSSCTLRLSTGRETSEKEVERAATVICRAVFEQLAAETGSSTWIMELNSIF